MINIFYNKKNLNDVMVVLVENNLLVNKIIKNEKFSILFSDEKLVGLNIFNVSYFKKFPEGFLYPTKEILDFIFSQTNISLNEYLDKNFVVGKILSFNPIPNTHLNYCVVDVSKNNPLNIICGAANVKQNLKVVVAMIGTCMPSGISIVKNKIQGKESFGMLCSEKELNISFTKNDGIIELPNDFEVGKLFKLVFNNL